MPMTIADLRALLDDFDDNAEIRLATQPSWPMEYTLRDHLAEDPETGVVYLVEGTQQGYLPSGVEGAW